MNFHPAYGYVIDSVTVNGTLIEPPPQHYTVTGITKDYDIDIAFKEAYVITSSTSTIGGVGVGGNITPAGSVPVSYNGDQKFTISTNLGFKINRVLIDSVPVAVAGNTYTFRNVNSNHTIYVEFARAD